MRFSRIRLSEVLHRAAVGDVDDGTRGGPLLVLSLMLALFAVDIPLILSFSVGRYQER